MRYKKDLRSTKEQQLEALLEKARRDLITYAKLTKPGYMVAPHLVYVSEWLMMVAKKVVKRLMIFMPPQVGKTELSLVRFVPWYLGNNPNDKVIISAYSAGLILAKSKNARDQLKEKIYSYIFPGVALSSDNQSAKLWTLASPHSGGAIAAGRGGAITGHGANLFIIDDPVKDRMEANSQSISQATWDWYRDVVETRLTPNSAIVLIMTRWSDDDLAGRIIESQGSDWVIIRIPALAEPNGRDLLGRKPGQSIWEERFPAAYYEKIKEEKPYTFASLYQGRPVPLEGGEIQASWLEYYDGTKDLPSEVSWYGGIDTATSSSQEACYSSMVEVAVADGVFYVHKVHLARMSVLNFSKYIVGRHLLRRFVEIGLESDGAGEAFRQRALEVAEEEKISGFERVLKSRKANISKIERLKNISPLIESGKVKFNKEDPGVMAMLKRLVLAPYVQVDDDIDAFVWAIKTCEDATKKADAYLDFIRRDIEEKIGLEEAEKRLSLLGWRNVNFN